MAAFEGSVTVPAIWPVAAVCATELDTSGKKAREKTNANMQTSFQAWFIDTPPAATQSGVKSRRSAARFNGAVDNTCILRLVKEYFGTPFRIAERGRPRGTCQG